MIFKFQIDEIIADSKERTRKLLESKPSFNKKFVFPLKIFIDLNLLDVYKKNIIWKKSKQEKLDIIKEFNKNKELKTCSFSPNMPVDLFFSSHFKQINF